MDLFAGLPSEIIVLLLSMNLIIYHCQESTELFVPLNLVIYNDSSQQRLSVNWNVSDQAYESGSNIMFHIQVGRDKEMKIIWNETYSTSLSKLNKAFEWSWESDLPLECASHHVRIRSSVNRKNITKDVEWSVWSPWKTHNGMDNVAREKPVIFPNDKVVNEGSDVSFCCIPGKNQKVLSIDFRGKKSQNTEPTTNNGKFVITAKNVSLTNNYGANVICRLTQNGRHGTVLFVSRPPEEPKHISCETEDVRILRCSWDPGQASNLFGVHSTNYSMHEWSSSKAISSCHRNSCNWIIEPSQQLYNFTLTAANPLGKKSVNIVVDVTENVRPLTSTNIGASVLNSTHVLLQWSLEADYTALVLLCQTELKRQDGLLELINTTMNGKKSSLTYSKMLNGLQPHANYALRVRCMAASPLSRWSNWSSPLTFRTEEDVPCAALDFWRNVTDTYEGRVVALYWRRLSDFHANGDILHYNVTWQALEGVSEVRSEIIPALQNSTEILIDSQPYVISITARNTAGTSPPSEIRIPAVTDNGAQHINEERTTGRDNGIYISWDSLPGVFRGYVVDWCNFPRSRFCDFQWRKFNSSIRNHVIKSSAFRAGVRYNFRISGSKEDGEYLLARRIGFKQELASSVRPTVKILKIKPDALSITWDPYPIDEFQKGFILGYNVYLNTAGMCVLKTATAHILSDGSHVCKFFINDPEKKNFTIKHLSPNTKYAVAVGVLTGGGETPIEFSNIQTLADSQAVILVIVLTVIIFSIMAIISLIVCYQKRTWIKDVCYPEIPDPRKGQALDGIKRNGEKNVMTLTACRTENIQIVNAPPAEDLDACKETKSGTNHLSDLIASAWDENDKTCGSLEENMNSSDFYYDPERKGGASEQHCQLPSRTYLEFYNENYRPTPEDCLDNIPTLGYKPQMGSLQPNQPLDVAQNNNYQLQSMDLRLRLASAEELPTFTSEEMSPTSINSIDFLLKD